MKKILIILLINIILIPNIYALDINSTNAVLYNLNDNKIVLDKNSDEKVSIASLTKIMTCLVAIENIDDMNKEVTITYEMLKGLIEANAYVVGLRVGQKVTIKDLLYATFLASGADAARGLAISVSGSESVFIDLMNQKAKDLNLNLHFSNVVGLDNPENYGTASAVAQLLIKALENDTFKEMFLTKEYKINNSSITVRSSMLSAAKSYKIDIPYVLGGKTGYTDNAGKCLASIAFDEKNNINYLLVTIGANPTTKNAYHVLDAKNIYEYYMNNYKYYDVLKENDILANIKVKYSDEIISIPSLEEIPIYHDKSFDTSKIEIKYEGLEEVSPFIKDQLIGKTSVYYDGELLSTYEITTKLLDSNILLLVQKSLGVKCLVVIIPLMLILIIAHIYIKKKYIKKVYR